MFEITTDINKKLNTISLLNGLNNIFRTNQKKIERYEQMSTQGSNDLMK